MLWCAKLASALLYGIRSDTDDYLTAREIDYRAASYLAPYADHELLMAISMQSISPRTMEITQRCFANKVIAMVVSDQLYETYLEERDFVVGKEAVAGALAKVKDATALGAVEQEQIRLRQALGQLLKKPIEHALQ